MRFKLHHVPDQNPVLAFCNAAGQIFFWDLARITAYEDFMAVWRDSATDRSLLRLPSWLKPVIRRPRTDTTSRGRATGSDRDSRTPLHTGITGQHGSAAQTPQTPQATHTPQTVRPDGGKTKEDAHEFSAETLESWASRYSTQDYREPLRAHKTESSNVNFVGRQAAWSPGGEWCVVVGSDNTALVLQRWAEKAPARATNGVR